MLRGLAEFLSKFMEASAAMSSMNEFCIFGMRALQFLQKPEGAYDESEWVIKFSVV